MNACYKCCAVLFIIITTLQAGAQQVLPVNDSLHRISQSNTASRYFALLYYRASTDADVYAGKQPAAAAAFLNRFKNCFAGYFFKAVAGQQQGLPQSFSWQRYYAGKSFSVFQYYFMGMNAHINGDMWQALVAAHPYDSIKKYKALLTGFQQPLSQLFNSIYNSCSKYKALSRFHLLTMGLDKWYGKKMMLHWRRQQIKLALLYSSNPAAFRRRLKRVHRKMLALDTLAEKLFTK